MDDLDCWRLSACRLLADEGAHLSFGGKDGAPAPNAYEVLGVGPKVEAAAARRQFMKLSLWVHPDKNAHPRAVDAFHAADMAFKAIRVRPTQECQGV
jgi:DnaJ domain